MTKTYAFGLSGPLLIVISLVVLNVYHSLANNQWNSNSSILKGLKIENKIGKIEVSPANIDSSITQEQVNYIVSNAPVSDISFSYFSAGFIEISGTAIPRIKPQKVFNPELNYQMSDLNGSLSLSFFDCGEISISDANLKAIEIQCITRKQAAIISIQNVFTIFLNMNLKSCGSDGLFENILSSEFKLDGLNEGKTMKSRLSIYNLKLLCENNSKVKAGSLEDLLTRMNAILISDNFLELHLEDVSISSKETKQPVMAVIEGSAMVFTFKNSTLSNTILKLNYFEILNAFHFENIQNLIAIGLKNLKFPDNHESVFWDWSEISDNKILVFKDLDAQDNTFKGTQVLDGFYASSLSDTVYKNLVLYKKLVSQYQTLLDFFKSQGDQISFNGCYKELKEIQTRYFKAQYQKKPDVEGWFNWQINHFLNWFCDYGTNPVKALFYCFYLMAIFASLYVVFPSEADNLNTSAIEQFFRQQLLRFFPGESTETNEKTELEQSIQKLNELATLIRTNKKETPITLSWLGTPITLLMLSFLDIRLWLARKVKSNSKPVAFTTPWHKTKFGILVGISVFFFLFWGLFMRILNAFALSLNAFVTLGYGEIEAIGVARYLAVLEGALGWFFLGIFSVSLISQILQ